MCIRDRSKVDIDTGRLRRTVAELAAEWLEAVRPNRKASTFSNYGWLMREVCLLYTSRCV